jgi:hypothetical protein
MIQQMSRMMRPETKSEETQTDTKTREMGIEMNAQSMRQYHHMHPYYQPEVLEKNDPGVIKFFMRLEDQIIKIAS